MRLRPPRQRGFTLVGAVALVAILGIAAAATVGAGLALQKRAAEQELLAVGLEFKRGFKSYYESAVSAQRYPSKLEDLLRDPRFPGIKRHLRRIYADPITGRSEWGVIPAPGGGIMGVYSLAPGTPIKIDLFDAELVGFEGKTRYADWHFDYAPQGFANVGAPAGATPAAAPGTGLTTAPAPAGSTAPTANQAVNPTPGNPGRPSTVPSSSVRR